MKECFNRHSFCMQKGISVYKLYGIIYCATNISNDKKYIGQTTRSLNRRKKEHIGQANRGSEYAIHQAIRKYGEDNFEWTILDHAHSQIELDEKEKFWIKYHNTFYKGGYNMATGGQCNISNNPEELSAMRGGRVFCVFDLEGNFIKETISQTEFAKEIGVCVGTVNNVLKGIKQSTKGYILIFKYELTDEKIIEQINKINDRHKPFAIFDKEQNLVDIRDNKMQCAKELHIERATIQRQLNQRTGVDNATKYQFYYLENVPEGLQYKIKDVI